MLKKLCRNTVLLLITLIISIVPAMASERLGNKQGTLMEAVSFQNGHYSYYGYRTEEDITGIWYSKGDGNKDLYNDELEDYTFSNASKYGDKYIYVKNNSNSEEYLIDLTTGKIVDNETVEDKMEVAKNKLQSSLRKAERYYNLKDSTGRITIAHNQFKQILTGQFGEVWYQFTTIGQDLFKTDFVSKSGVTTTTSQGVIFTDNSENYIDASYIANMKIFSSKKKRAVTINNYDEKDNNSALEVHLENIEVIAQDKDYLYSITTVKVADTSGLPYAMPEEQYFLQRISKAPGDKKDGAYLPSSVTSYQLDNKSIYNNSDMEEAYKVIFNINGTNLDGYNAENNLYSIKNDVLYVTSVKENKVKVYTLKLGKIKADVIASDNTVSVDSDTSPDIVAENVDIYLVKKDNGDYHDTMNVTLKNKSDNSITNKIIKLSSAVSLDTEGYTWILDKGKIYKYVDGSFKEIYNCDRSFDSLDVYNNENLIVWDSKGGAYTTVQEGKKQTVDEAIIINPDLGNNTKPVKIGWDKLPDGTWNFYDLTGNKVISKWINVEGIWYYLKVDGIMATGWLNDRGTWYYLNQSGAMKTGWLNDGGTWYYLSSSGAMKTGWLNDGGTWYYLYYSGAMAYNATIDGYKLGSNGAWIKQSM